MQRNRNPQRYMMNGNLSAGSYRINDEKKHRKSRRRNRLIAFLIAGLAVVVAAVIFLNFFSDRGRSSVGNATRIYATIQQNLAPFGDKVIFYDGTHLQCVSASGANVWSYRVGSNADYSVNAEKVIAWSGNDLYILNNSGRLLYNNKMADTIQFASIGREYAAVFTGSSDNGTVTVINMNGQLVDNIAVSNETLLEIGFFDAATTSSTQTTELMWMMGIDTSGTVISMILQTYQPGRLSTGNSSLGEHIAYRVFDNNGILNVVTTREIFHYNYRIIEDSTSTLIYGYTMEDVKKVGNTVYQLLIPSKEQTGSATISNVRLMYGNTDRMLHFPSNCIAAKLGTRCVYGFSGNTVYACRYGETSFEAFPVNLKSPITNVIGMLDDNRAIVSAESEIYILELPL